MTDRPALWVELCAGVDHDQPAARRGAGGAGGDVWVSDYPCPTYLADAITRTAPARVLDDAEVDPAWDTGDAEGDAAAERYFGRAWGLREEGMLRALRRFSRGG